MNLLLIGLLSISVIAVVVLLVAWMFFRATNDGYYIDDEGEATRPSADESAADAQDYAPAALIPEEQERPPIDYVSGFDIIPAFLSLTDDSPVFDDAPSAVIARKEGVHSRVVNEFMNDSFRHEGFTYEESGPEIALRAEGEVFLDGDAGRLVVRSVVVGLEVPEPGSDTPIAETLYARPLMLDVAQMILAVIEENPRVKVNSAATTRKVAAAYAKEFPSSDAQVGIKIISYEAEMSKR